jgi:SagB-type dehydrogenase family enzyme
MSLTEALAQRRSVRAFAAAPVTDAELAQLLWAAQGITEPKHKLRTSPSAHNWYLVHVYVVAADGLWEYQPEGHKLVQFSGTDYRQTISPQPSVKAAPLSLLVVGEYDRAVQVAGDAAVGRRFVDLEAGHLTQNVLLQATALHLGAVSVGGVDPAAVQKLLALPADRTAIYLIPVGKPKQ